MSVAPIYRRILHTSRYAYPGIKKERYRGSVKRMVGFESNERFSSSYMYILGEKARPLDYESFGKVLYDGDRANDHRHPVGEWRAKEFYSRDRIVPLFFGQISSSIATIAQRISRREAGQTGEKIDRGNKRKTRPISAM